MPELEQQSAGQVPANEQQADNTAGTPASTAAPEAGATAGDSGGDSGGDDTFAALPPEWNWLRDKYQKRGSEAQKLRSDLREVQEKLASAKSPEEFAQVQQETAELNRKLAISDAARKHKLSDDALELLDGVPAGQIEARAEKLAKLATPAQEVPPKKVTKVPLRGGTTPGEDADTEDGAALWRKYRASQ